MTDALDGSGLIWESGGEAPWFGQTNLTHDGLDAAQSGVITNSQVSWLQTTVIGPGPLSFWWKVSSELEYDAFCFAIDGVEQIGITGEVNWQQRVFSIPPGAHILKWWYAKDASQSEGLDRAWLDQVNFSPPGNSAPVITSFPVNQTVAAGASISLSVTAVAVPPPAYQWSFNGSILSQGTNQTLTLYSVTTNQSGWYAVRITNSVGSVTSAPVFLKVTLLGEAVDAPGWVWGIGGDASWFEQASINHDGIDAAQSGAVTNFQQAWIQTMVNGPGVLTFWWKVSSEPQYDGLEFSTNGVRLTTLSGEAQWEQKTFRLGRGPNLLRWRYSKDGSIGMGQDAGWVDEVAFVPDKEPAPFSFLAPACSPGGFQANLTGETNHTYYVQVSTNLIQWSVVTNFIGPTGAVLFLDLSASNAPRRFYRAFVP